MEKLYTPEELAELLKTSRETIYNWLRSGKLKGIKVVNFWRIPESELKRFLGLDGNNQEDKE